MRRSALILGAGAAFVASLVLGAPLRAGLAFAPKAFSAEQVEGTIWGGEAERARLGRLSLGDVRLGLEPLALLAGRAAVRFEARGDVEGRGAAVLLGGSGLTGFTGSAPIEALGLGIPLTGRISFSRVDAMFVGSACRQARGDVATDAFRASAATLRWQGPDLAGTLSCAEDGALVASLEGADGRASVAATLRLFADGRYALETRVAPSDDGLAMALPLGGFAPGPGGFTRLDEGRMGDAGGA